MRILITEDSEFYRYYLSLALAKWNHEVLLAEDGRQALEVLRQDKGIQMLITDWVMPNMNGLELCKHVRSSNLGHYIYIIMLTGQEDNLPDCDGYSNGLTAALTVGADAFLKKPVDHDELAARICAGERMLSREGDLTGYNKSLCQSNDKLREQQQTVQQELEYAAQIQKKFLPQYPVINQLIEPLGIRCASRIIPSGVVSGDSLNFFRLDESDLGFYHLDVAGHGVSSAMLSVGLNQMISPNSGLLKAIDLDKYPKYCLVQPDKVAEELNRNHLSDEENSLYFTLIYGLFNADTGRVRLTQAGHPSPILIQDGEVKLLGDGGFPVGLVNSAEYNLIEFTLNPGDRLILYSDGVTECENLKGECFGESLLLELCEQQQNMILFDWINRLVERLTMWHGSPSFSDDISLLMLERLE